MPEEAIEFAPWPTPFENDRLELVSMSYRGLGTIVELHPENTRLAVPPTREESAPELDAVFLSLDQLKLFRVSVPQSGAFRVLDEHGLTELWAASSEQGGRPANATFRVRHHGWSRESVLSFVTFASDGYSYIVATDWACLEIVCPEPPDVEELGPPQISPLEPGPMH